MRVFGSLSPFAYFVRNKKKALPVVAVIVLAVFAVCLTAVLTGSMIASARLAWVEPFRAFSVVQASKDVLDPKVVRQLRASRDIGRLMPVLAADTRVFGIFGSDGRTIYALRDRDMKRFMERTGLTLVEGRLPRPGKAEAALHADILKGKDGVTLGSEIGREVDEKDGLPGKYRVVGVLGGRMPAGLASYEYMKANSPLAGAGDVAFVLFPRPGREGAVETLLATFPRDRVTVRTHATESRNFAQEVKSLDLIIWVLNLVTILVMALATGLLNVIFFLQRLGEYGILAAMGYTRGFLVTRTFLEILWTTAVGWLIGLGLSRWAIGLVSRAIYEPRGIPLTGIDGRVLAFTLPIPLMIAAFSLLVVLWHLWRLDPVSIVERRD